MNIRINKMYEILCSDLRAGEKLLYVALSLIDNNKKGCFPSIKTLSKMLNISERSISRYLNTLRKKGYITTVQRWNNSNKYYLDTELNTKANEDRVVSMETTELSSGGDSIVIRGMTGLSSGGDRAVYLNNKLNSKLNINLNSEKKFLNFHKENLKEIAYPYETQEEIKKQNQINLNGLKKLKETIGGIYEKN